MLSMPFVEDKRKAAFSENSEDLLEHPVHTKPEDHLCDVRKGILKLSYSKERKERVEGDNGSKDRQKQAWLPSKGRTARSQEMSS